MPRFDLTVEFPGHTGKRERFHTVGDALDLDHLPSAVAAALGSRIAEQCGVAPTGPDSPEKEKQYVETIRAMENANGPQPIGLKNQVRKALGLAPIRSQAPEPVAAVEPVAEDKPRGRKPKQVE